MSFYRSLLLLCIVSLSVSLGLLFLGSGAGYSDYHGGYAVLETEASVDDRFLRERLDAGLSAFSNLFAGAPVSESSQWVLLDTFGSLETVPLDKFSQRVFPFDPRNDGYAEKLREVFVQDGKRFVYIPLNAGNRLVTVMDNHFKEILQDIPFSIKYFGIGKPLSFFFFLYAAAAVLLLIICYMTNKSYHGEMAVIALLPVLSCLAFMGAYGFAFAALFIGLFVMLKEPFKELCTMPFKPDLIYKDVIERYKSHWFLSAFFAVIALVLLVFSKLNFLFFLMVFAAACVVFFLSVKTLSLWKGSHRRFVPVMIIKRRLPDFAFSLYMIPLIAASIAAMILTPHMSGSYVSEGQFEHIIEEQDYLSHLTFQSSFSVQKIGLPGTAFQGFIFDEDGLVAPDKASTGIPAVNFRNFPPFPLKHLMDFFKSVNTGAKTVNLDGGRGIYDYMPLILLLFFLPGLLFRGKKVMRFRRDINRKKMLLFNSNNTLRIQRGTSSLGHFKL